jgi:hypothetical protein
MYLLDLERCSVGPHRTEEDTVSKSIVASSSSAIRVRDRRAGHHEE